MTIAEVMLWGRRVGVVSVERASAIPVFQYAPDFVRTGFEVSPVAMPLREAPYSFPELARVDAFEGLPGLLADSLPDRWGRTLVDSWLRSQGRSRSEFDVVERLCYTGRRGMGALEFEPAMDATGSFDAEVEMDELVALANEVLSERSEFVAELSEDPSEQQLMQLLSVGTSAGGARPKAVIAYNEQTGEVRSGQVDAGSGFSYWIIKFDGVAKSGDHGLVDPQGWGAIEFAYSRMATEAGIEMSECRLLEENGRRHFMTKRFDRTEGGDKLHLQTIAALEHLDYNVPAAYSYEQAFRLLRLLGGSALDAEQLYRRMAFNVVARNQDDHVKNFAFTMDRDGLWSLAPAYDLTWSYKPGNVWLEAHQMTINGKRDDFGAEDLYSVAQVAGLKRGRDRAILREVSDAVAHWSLIAGEIGVEPTLRDAVRNTHRLELLA